MMSVLIKQDGVFKLLLKGADSAVLDQLNYNEKQPFLEVSKEKLDLYSKQGLRTLCMGVRVLSANEVKNIMDESFRINQ